MEPDQGEHLGVNEWHIGPCRSLAQASGQLWSYEVDPGRMGCCTRLLYQAALMIFTGWMMSDVAACKQAG